MLTDTEVRIKTRCRALFQDRKTDAQQGRNSTRHEKRLLYSKRSEEVKETFKLIVLHFLQEVPNGSDFINCLWKGNASNRNENQIYFAFFSLRTSVNHLSAYEGKLQKHDPSCGLISQHRRQYVKQTRGTGKRRLNGWMNDKNQEAVLIDTGSGLQTNSDLWLQVRASMENTCIFKWMLR